MSKTKEWFMEEEEKKAEELNKDLSWEHEMHHKFIENCSECAKKTGVEVTNAKQESNLSKLRASIQAQREKREVPSGDSNVNVFAEPKKLEIQEVPVIYEMGRTEFNLERHTQLCEKVNVLYHNFLYEKEQALWTIIYPEDNSDAKKYYFRTEEFQNCIKELSETYDELLNEGLKIRWS